MLRARREWDELIERQMALLAAVNPGPAGNVKAAVVLAGIAGASGPTFVDLDQEVLREHLVDAGRRVLGLRTPRRRRRRRLTPQHFQRFQPRVSKRRVMADEAGHRRSHW